MDKAEATIKRVQMDAARHWARVGTEFLSNVDAHDLVWFFKAAGLEPEEAKIMLQAAQKLTDFSEQLMAEE